MNHIFVERRKVAITPAYLRLKGAAAYVGMSVQMLLKLHRAGEGRPGSRKEERCSTLSRHCKNGWTRTLGNQ